MNVNGAIGVGWVGIVLSIIPRPRHAAIRGSPSPVGAGWRHVPSICPDYCARIVSSHQLGLTRTFARPSVPSGLGELRVSPAAGRVGRRQTADYTSENVVN